MQKVYFFYLRRKTSWETVNDLTARIREVRARPSSKLKHLFRSGEKGKLTYREGMSSRFMSTQEIIHRFLMALLPTYIYMCDKINL